MKLIPDLWNTKPAQRYKKRKGVEMRSRKEKSSESVMGERGRRGRVRRSRRTRRRRVTTATLHTSASNTFIREELRNKKNLFPSSATQRGWARVVAISWLAVAISEAHITQSTVGRKTFVTSLSALDNVKHCYFITFKPSFLCYSLTSLSSPRLVSLHSGWKRRRIFSQSLTIENDNNDPKREISFGPKIKSSGFLLLLEGRRTHLFST